MFGFKKVTVNMEALASLMRRRHFNVTSVEKNRITIKGEYLNRQRKNQLLYLQLRDGKFFFEDTFGNAVTHIKQGVAESEIFTTLKEIYNIV